MRLPGTCGVDAQGCSDDESLATSRAGGWRANAVMAVVDLGPPLLHSAAEAPIPGARAGDIDKYRRPKDVFKKTFHGSLATAPCGARMHRSNK